jgi:hypothetical protein
MDAVNNPPQRQEIAGQPGNAANIGADETLEGGKQLTSPILPAEQIDRQAPGAFGVYGILPAKQIDQEAPEYQPPPLRKDGPDLDTAAAAAATRSARLLRLCDTVISYIDNIQITTGTIRNSMVDIRNEFDGRVFVDLVDLHTPEPNQNE